VYLILIFHVETNSQFLWEIPWKMNLSDDFFPSKDGLDSLVEKATKQSYSSRITVLPIFFLLSPCGFVIFMGTSPKSHH
jgi:hypothetical protein